MKKIFLILVFSFIVFLPKFALAENKVNIYFFYGDGCPHCAKEEVFLDSLKKEYPEINIKAYEVWSDRDNAKIMANIGKKLNLQISGVPLTIIGDKTFSGFYTAETTGADIKKTVEEALNKGCRDVVSPIIGGDNNELNQCEHGCDQGDEECLHNCGCSADTVTTQGGGDNINLPFIGQVNSKNL